jgi:hypothetical protein
MLTKTLRFAPLLSFAALLFAATPRTARAADTCNLLTTAEISAATADPVTSNTLKGSHYIILRVNVPKFSSDQNQAAMKTLATSALGRL